MYLNVNTDLSPESRECVGAILNQALADEFALSAAARDYHWNVTGPHFHSLHELFDEQYHAIDDWIEKIGERARVLGVVAQTGWDELIHAPRFAPTRGADLNARRMMAVLVDLHDRMAVRLRSDAERCTQKCRDTVTGDLLREIVEYHETTSWMLSELLRDRELAQA